MSTTLSSLSTLFLPSVADNISVSDLTLNRCALPTTLGSCPTYLGRGASARARWLQKHFPDKWKISVKTGRFLSDTEKHGKALARSSFVLEVLCTGASSANAGRDCKRQCLLLYKPSVFALSYELLAPCILRTLQKFWALCEVLVVMPKKCACICDSAPKIMMSSGCRSVHWLMN